MVNIDIVYKGDLHCDAVHGPSGKMLSTDAPVDNQGKGESFSPTDLCATALGSCMATIMGIQARTSEIDISGMKVNVGKIMSEGLPRRIAALEVNIEVFGALSDKHQKQLVRAAESCPVKHSLHPDIDIRLSFEWKS